MTNSPHIAHALSRRCPNEGMWQRKDLQATWCVGPGATNIAPEQINRRATINLETRQVTEDVKTNGNEMFAWRKPLPGGRQNIVTTFYYEADISQKHTHQTLNNGRPAAAQ